MADPAKVSSESSELPSVREIWETYRDHINSSTTRSLGMCLCRAC
jgi:hypothetical protein